jgi:hypothetical protein
MVTIKESLRNEIRRYVKKILDIELCEVIAVNLHSSPNDGKNNTMTLRLRDTPPNADQTTGKCIHIKRFKVVPLDSIVGYKWGLHYTPRIHDLVLSVFLMNEKAYVLSLFFNQLITPICRQHPEDIVLKLCQQPAYAEESVHGIGNCDEKTLQRYTEDPKFPVCAKWYGKDRCFILVSECPKGHANPDCNECKDMNDIINYSNSLKLYSSSHDGQGFGSNTNPHPRRVRLSQFKGAFIQLEDDGSIVLKNVNSQGDRAAFIVLKEDGILLQDKAGSFIALNGSGNLEVHAASSGAHNLHRVNEVPEGHDNMGGTTTLLQESE